MTSIPASMKLLSFQLSMKNPLLSHRTAGSMILQSTKGVSIIFIAELLFLNTLHIHSSSMVEPDQATAGLISITVSMRSLRGNRS